MKRVILMIAAVLALALVGSSLMRSADAQYKGGGGARDKWEYGLLTINNGPPLFTTAKEQAIATPPTDNGNNGQSATGRYPDRVNLVTRETWSAEMMTMSALGAEGWEAVSMINVDGKGTVILMRRKV